MTTREIERAIKSIQNGDNKPLDDIFSAYYAYCVNWLLNKYSCTQADAEDLFMDAMLIFRTQVIHGKVDARNIKGYLITVAKNIYLQRLRRKNIDVEYLPDQLEYILGKDTGLYDEDFDPLLKKEQINLAQEVDKQKYLAYQDAWKKLGEKCQNLLKRFYIDRVKLKDLQEELGYGSYDSIKSTKLRCFKQLKKLAQDLFINDY